MSAFPDMVVIMDGLETTGATVLYHWTLTGTNTGRVALAGRCISAATRNGPSGPMG
jgi:hypothetical protein